MRWLDDNGDLDEAQRVLRGIMVDARLSPDRPDADDPFGYPLLGDDITLAGAEKEGGTAPAGDQRKAETGGLECNVNTRPNDGTTPQKTSMISMVPPPKTDGTTETGN